MRLKEEVDFLRKEQEKLADLELLRMQEEKEMRKGREVNEGRLLKPSVESDNEKVKSKIKILFHFCSG